MLHSPHFDVAGPGLLTVAKAAAAVTKLEPFIFNVHALGGLDMMKRAAETTASEAAKLGIVKPIVLAVTILTSLDAKSLKEIGLGEGPKGAALKLAHLAKKAGLDRTPRVLGEVRLPAAPDLKVGDVVTVAAFAEGQLVDVIGVSKGKGFQGVVKRFRVAGGPAAHGSMFHRRIGSIGMRQTPGRSWKNQSMPGHMGSERRTMQNLRVVKVIAEKNLILVKGAIPGANGGDVIVRSAIKGQPKTA